MTQPGGPPRLTQSRPRQVHLVLRDGAVVEGGIFLNEGQALAPYLGSRKGGWVNIVNALWLAEGETSNHAVLQSDHILLATSIDADIPIYPASAQPMLREVDVAIEDGTRVRGVLHLAAKQRLSDFLHSCGKFVPLLNARRLPGDTELGDVAVNALAIRVIRDATLLAPGPIEAAPEGASEARASVSMPYNREIVSRESSAFEVITEGRVPDRRIGKTYTSPVPVGTPALAIHEPNEENLTDDERRLADWLSRHWLVQLGAGAQLLPPDPRQLSAEPTIEDVWHGLAMRNGMADGEVAIQVAAAFRLPVADLDRVTAEALAEIPEKFARKVFSIPLRIEGKDLVLAVADPSSLEIEQQVGFITRMRLRFEIATPANIRGALDWHYRAPSSAT
jgi:hypothetical protein